MVFGRKKVDPPSSGGGSSVGGSPNDDKNQPGHQAVLRHLLEEEKKDPGIRERLAGAVLFDFAYELMKDERGVNIDSLLAMLASVGGQQCISPIFNAAAPDATLEQMGLMGIKGNDGRLYLFGDPPNRLLIESQDSLIGLAFGAAQALGAPVTMEMIHDEMRLVASRVGGPEFEILDLPPDHMVDKPTEWARVFTAKIIEPLDLYDVPPMRRATAIGYAISKAMEVTKGTVDPLLAARIVLQCATRTSKVFMG